MNYLVLKTILSNAVTTFACPHCQSRIKDNNLFLTGLTQEGIAIAVDCPSCHRRTDIQAALKFFPGVPGSSNNNFASGMNPIMSQSSPRIEKNTINDAMIRSLHHEIRTIVSVSDLFNGSSGE